MLPDDTAPNPGPPTGALQDDLPPTVVQKLIESDVVRGGIAPVAEPRPVRHTVVLDGTGTDTRAVVDVAVHRANVALSSTAEASMAAGRAVVDRALERGDVVYGLNTGLGPRRDERVSPELLAEYQRHIVLSHAGAVGDPLSEREVRAVLFARLAGISTGGAGASPAIAHHLAALLDANVLPVVPEISSVGASDLAALAAVGEVLIGAGRATHRGVVVSGAEGLRRAGLAPLVLQPKDALSIISANAVSIGVGALVVEQASVVAGLADLAGALSLEAVNGNLSPFEPEVHAAKPFRGQGESAAQVLALLSGSYLGGSGPHRSLQDPLSFRTIPQVHGAFRDVTRSARDALETELRSRSDNPLVAIESGRTLSNGNFHPMVLALAFETLRIGAAHVGMVAERRTGKLAMSHLSRLSIDAQLREGGSARTLATTVAYSAANLSSQIKQLAQPVTLGLPSLNNDVEDHGTLAPVAVLQARNSMDKLEILLSIEILLAASLLAHRGSGVRLGAGSWHAYDLVARVVEAAPTATTSEIISELRSGLVTTVVPALTRDPHRTETAA